MVHMRVALSTMYGVEVGATLIVWLASLHILDLRYVRPIDRMLARALVLPHSDDLDVGKSRSSAHWTTQLFSRPADEPSVSATVSKLLNRRPKTYQPGPVAQSVCLALRITDVSDRLSAYWQTAFRRGNNTMRGDSIVFIRSVTELDSEIKRLSKSWAVCQQEKEGKASILVDPVRLAGQGVISQLVLVYIQLVRVGSLRSSYKRMWTMEGAKIKMLSL